MTNITIGRYTQRGPDDVPDVHVVADHTSGWIEGTRDDGSNWIIFLAADGSPETYWARRDEGGGVLGDPIALT